MLALDNPITEHVSGRSRVTGSFRSQVRRGLDRMAGTQRYGPINGVLRSRVISGELAVLQP